jgi:hypothetical protein
MDTTEKKELETISSGGGGAAESEQEGKESERYARELKSGLHPFKVFLSITFFLDLIYPSLFFLLDLCEIT